MECVRCGGLMVAECYCDLEETGGYDRARCWRCLNCGEVVDPLIDQYRRMHLSRRGRVPQELRRMPRFSRSVGMRVKVKSTTLDCEGNASTLRLALPGVSGQKRSGGNRQG